MFDRTFINSFLSYSAEKEDGRCELCLICQRMSKAVFSSVVAHLVTYKMYIFSAFILCPFDYAKRCTHVICLCSTHQSYLIRYMLLFFCVFYVNIVSVDRPIPVTGGVSYIELNAHSQIRFWMGNMRTEIPTLPFDIYMCDFVCGTMLS